MKAPLLLLLCSMKDAKVHYALVLASEGTNTYACIHINSSYLQEPLLVTFVNYTAGLIDLHAYPVAFPECQVSLCMHQKVLQITILLVSRLLS